jgi:hypothetical protein
MFRTVFTAAALAACAGTTGAQPSIATAPAPANPLDARAEVPTARLPSPLENYRRHTGVEIQPGTWRAANDNVNRIGGWRTYAREAQATAPGAAAANAGPPPATTAVPAQPPAAAAGAPAAAAPSPATTGPAPAAPAPAHRH